MKRLTLIIGILLTVQMAWAGIHTYSQQSVLREGNIIKVQVSETGDRKSVV